MSEKNMTQKVLEKILSPSEKVSYQFSLGNKYLKIKKITTICFGFLILLVISIALVYLTYVSEIIIVVSAVAFWALLILFSYFYFGWYLKRTNIYLITNRRVIIHKGWLCTNMISTPFNQITDIKVIEPFFDRLIFKVGTLKINTAGMEDHAITLSYIENPYNIKRKLNELRFFSEKGPHQATNQTSELN